MNEEGITASTRLTPMGYIWVLVAISVIVFSGMYFAYHFMQLKNLESQNQAKINQANAEIEQLNSYKSFLVQNGLESKSDFFTR